MTHQATDTPPGGGKYGLNNLIKLLDRYSNKQITRTMGLLSKNW